MMRYTAERVWNGNITEREYGGRIYTGTVGWVWIVRKNGELLDDVFKTLREVLAKYPLAQKIRVTR